MNKQIKNIVEWLLISNAETRDNDPLLYALIVEALGYGWLWLQETLEKVNYQGVRTTRQRLQMLNNDLRWKSYKERQRYAGDVRKKMRLTYWEKMKNFLIN